MTKPPKSPSEGPASSHSRRPSASRRASANEISMRSPSSSKHALKSAPHAPRKRRIQPCLRRQRLQRRRRAAAAAADRKRPPQLHTNMTGGSPPGEQDMGPQARLGSNLPAMAMSKKLRRRSPAGGVRMCEGRMCGQAAAPPRRRLTV